MTDMASSLYGWPPLTQEAVRAGSRRRHKSHRSLEFTTTIIGPARAQRNEA